MRGPAQEEYVEYVTGRLASLRQLAFLLCGDEHRADDIVQQTIEKLYLRWGRASPGRPSGPARPASSCPRPAGASTGSSALKVGALSDDGRTAGGAAVKGDHSGDEFPVRWSCR